MMLPSDETASTFYSDMEWERAAVHNVVPIKKESTSVPGIFKVVVAAADAQGRWKPESSHEYFGIAVDAGFKGGVWPSPDGSYVFIPLSPNLGIAPGYRDFNQAPKITCHNII